MTKNNNGKLQSEFTNSLHGLALNIFGFFTFAIFMLLFQGPTFGFFENIDTVYYILLLGLIASVIEVIFSLAIGEATLVNAVVCKVNTPIMFIIRVGISCSVALTMFIALILRIKGVL